MNELLLIYKVASHAIYHQGRSYKIGGSVLFLKWAPVKSKRNSFCVAKLH